MTTTVDTSIHRALDRAFAAAPASDEAQDLKEEVRASLIFQVLFKKTILNYHSRKKSKVAYNNCLKIQKTEQLKISSTTLRP
jgi:hypothetical protein